MSCPEITRMQAFLHGELDDSHSASAEAHIAGCAECKKMSEETAELSDAVGRGATYHRAPAELRARITALLDAEPASLSPVRAGGRNFWLGAASGMGVSALAAAFALLFILPPSAGTLADQVIDAHTDALMSGKSIAVVSSNHHTVKPWFAGRIPVSPPVADFAPQGFTLTGGRLDRIADNDAAVVVYRHGAHWVDLFVWADKGASLPGNAIRHGYHADFWKSGDLDFAAVSDTDPLELKKFVGLVKNELE